MIATRKQTRRQINDLKMDLEVINPIESKTVLGGDWYDLDTVYVYNDYHDYGGAWDNLLGNDYNDPGSWDYGDGSGGGSASSPDGVLENPNAAEIWWLSNQVSVQELAKMIDNRDFAFEKSSPLPGLTDGIGDAFRHSLWSAADAADIGIERATAFHTLHETSNPDQSNAMDLFNNNWGFDWFSQHGDPVSNMNQFITDFNNAVANGQIQIHP